MKIAVTALIVALLISAASISYYISQNNTSRQKTILTTPSPNPSPTPIPTSTPTSAPTPSPTPEIFPSLTEIQLSNWEVPSGVQGSIAIIDSPTNNAEYSASTIALDIHAGVQKPYILIDVVLKLDGSSPWQLFNNINSGWLAASGMTIAAKLTGISDGDHIITVISNYSGGSLAGSSSVNFTINCSKTGS